jgi:hypothetical protein
MLISSTLPSGDLATQMPFRDLDALTASGQECKIAQEQRSIVLELLATPGVPDDR